MKKTNVVLSFDDGRSDNYRIAIEELLPRGLNATFNITSGYIEKNIPLEGMCPNVPMTIDNVVEISNHSAFEIAGHGYAHINDPADWKKGIDTLKKWIGSTYFNHGCGMASPHSVVDPDWLKTNRTICDELNIVYIRTGLMNQRSILQRAVSKAARETKNPLLMYLPVKGSLNKHSQGQYLFYSVPILQQHSLEQIIFLIEKTISSDGDVIFMLHSILKPYEEYYNDMFSWDYFKFIGLCDHLVEMKEKGLIEVKRNIDVISERS